MTRLLALLLAAAAVAAEAGTAPEGAQVFHARCARCHGETGKSDGSAARALKVAPLVNDPELARMEPAAIAARVRADPKHVGVVDLDAADMEAAAVFVRELAGHR